MTKQEYQESIKTISAPNTGIRMLEGIRIRNEYIASLEAENAALTLLHTQATDQMIKMQNRVHELEAENKLLNAAMDKAIEIFADDGAIACPALKVDYECNDGYGCNNLDIVNTSACWREFLMQETADGATQTPLHVSDATQKE